MGYILINPVNRINIKDVIDLQFYMDLVLINHINIQISLHKKASNYFEAQLFI